MPRHDPMHAVAAFNRQPLVSEQEAVRDARRSLGRQLAALAAVRGLGQARAPNPATHRTTIALVEAGDRASRDLAEAVYRVLGTGGRLTAARDKISAAVAARCPIARRPPPRLEVLA
jgi:hypothetical protein